MGAANSSFRPNKQASSTSPTRLVLFAVALLAALSACGGGGSGTNTASGDKTFSDEEFGITFTYPAKFRTGDPGKAAESEGEAEARAGVWLDDENGIAVSKYSLNEAVTRDNLAAVVPQLDELVSDLTGESVTGTPTTIGGFPAVTYDQVPVPEPEDAESRLVFVLDNRTEYLINCQWTPDNQRELREACDQVAETLKAA